MQAELAPVFGGSQKHVGVIELPAEMFGDQAGLAHGVEHAERASVAQGGMACAVPDLE